MGVLVIGLTKYFVFYNEVRPHQSLGNRTPTEVYRTGAGGGAVIVDKYGPRQSEAADAPAGQAAPGQAPKRSTAQPSA